jgi:hypothetical protein
MPVTELVPLAEEVVPVVITDLGDDGMHDRDLRDTRRVDDQLAAVGDNRLQLVKTLSRRPDVFLLGGHHRQHGSVRAVKVDDSVSAEIPAQNSHASSGGPNAAA